MALVHVHTVASAGALVQSATSPADIAALTLSIEEAAAARDRPCPLDVFVQFKVGRLPMGFSGMGV